MEVIGDSIQFEYGSSLRKVRATYIPLPAFLAAKKAIINLRNEDDKCFKWAITRALTPVEKTLNVMIENFGKHQRHSIGRN